MCSRRVAITGSVGFTGRYVVKELVKKGYEVQPIKSSINDVVAISEEITASRPNAIIHLAAQSTNFGANRETTYFTNVIGTQNILTAAASLKLPPRKVIIASTAAVYGESGRPLKENDRLAPVTHYGCSKLSMEYIAEVFADKFELIITRPFNYTGVGQPESFVIPKVVEAFRKREGVLYLGNIDTEREYNDVRDIAQIYVALIESDFAGRVINLCSGQVWTLRKIINHLTELSDYAPSVKIDNKFVRDGEPQRVCGAPDVLIKSLGFRPRHSLSDTLAWMYLK